MNWIHAAYDYLAEAVLLDHHDTANNTADGLHLAALASGWMAVILGLGGTRHHNGRLSFAPRLPQALHRVAFPFSFQGRNLKVEISQTEATYRLLSGAELEIDHWGGPLTVTREGPVARPIPPAAPVPMLRQPSGRAPLSRRGSAADHDVRR